MRELYPDIKPYATHTVRVDERHTLYVEECGNPDGLPVIFLHGGPGAGCEALHRRFFDPQAYRIVLFDQRGCGRSTPHADLTDNTTWHLVSDMENLRNFLDIEQWVVFGGSWGSTLALAYAETHTPQVLGLILRGIFLGRTQDVNWLFQAGASRLFPDAWEQFLEPIPKAEHHDLVNAYYRRLIGSNELERLRVAKTWSTWEAMTSTLTRKPALVDHFSDAHRALSLARIEAHYFVNQLYLESNQLLNEVWRLADVPSVIVHGRYDIVCPVEQAWTLYKAWPQAELCIIPAAGHAASEPGIADALVKATQALARKLA